MSLLFCILDLFYELPWIKSRPSDVIDRVRRKKNFLRQIKHFMYEYYKENFTNCIFFGILEELGNYLADLHDYDVYIVDYSFILKIILKGIDALNVKN